MPNLTIKTPHIQEVEEGFEVSIIEVPAVSIEGVAIPPPNIPYKNRYHIGVFDEVTEEAISDRFSVKYPVNSPSMELTEDDIRNLVSWATSSVV